MASDAFLKLINAWNVEVARGNIKKQEDFTRSFQKLLEIRIIKRIL